VNLKFKNFQNTLLRNSEEVDSFIKKNLPRNEGLNKKLIQAIKYSIIGSGKKIRSFLVIEVGKVVSNINNLTFDKKKNDELKIIGKVINLENEQNNLLVIELFKNQKKVLIPFVKEIVPLIDLKNNFLVINPPNGLLEL